MFKILLKRHFLSRMRKLNYRERLVETAVSTKPGFRSAINLVFIFDRGRLPYKKGGDARRTF